MESIENFYKRKFDTVPADFYNQIGHFNIFPLDPFIGKNKKPIPYQHRDFYKIMLVIGSGRVHYADRIKEVQKQALSFSNPKTPYKWENTEAIRTGFFCIFSKDFFYQFGDINQYSVFQPNGTHIFELTKEQVKPIQEIYTRMQAEMNSNYVHKYDVLRNLVFELLHFAMKMQPSSQVPPRPINAAQKISTLFLELLERQFPIDDMHSKISLRSASEYAHQLNIHVNHLNKTLKEINQKPTSQIIAERILQEAKILLKHSSWNISEIGFALGFTEPSHFNNFFKKHAKVSPLQFRN